MSQNSLCLRNTGKKPKNPGRRPIAMPPTSCPSPARAWESALSRFLLTVGGIFRLSGLMLSCCHFLACAERVCDESALSPQSPQSPESTHSPDFSSKLRSEPRRARLAEEALLSAFSSRPRRTAVPCRAGAVPCWS